MAIHFLVPLRIALPQSDVDLERITVPYKVLVGARVLLANCTQHAWAQVERVHKLGQRYILTLSHAPQDWQSDELLLIGLVQTVYDYMGRTPRQNMAGKPVDALYSLTPSGRRQELVPDMAGWSLQVLQQGRLVDVHIRTQDESTHDFFQLNVLLSDDS